ncbi:MAG TPA: SDR family NAD(P)-dependent oxidoreductase [Trebonia sp.]|nr:SDR family NAD(P)-dependent oxidoreductase [Trebonia sp.]
MKLDGKVAVVTGSGNGIGEAIARRFAAEGGRVVVTDIEPEAVSRVADEIGTVGLAADITQPASVRAVAELARTTFGEVDVWLSNAGVAGPRHDRPRRRLPSRPLVRRPSAGGESGRDPSRRQAG